MDFPRTWTTESDLALAYAPSSAQIKSLSRIVAWHEHRALRIVSWARASSLVGQLAAAGLDAHQTLADFFAAILVDPRLARVSR